MLTLDVENFGVQLRRRRLGVLIHERKATGKNRKTRENVKAIMSTGLHQEEVSSRRSLLQKCVPGEGELEKNEGAGLRGHSGSLPLGQKQAGYRSSNDRNLIPWQDEIETPRETISRERSGLAFSGVERTGEKGWADLGEQNFSPRVCSEGFRIKKQRRDVSKGKQPFRRTGVRVRGRACRWLHSFRPSTKKGVQIYA